MDDRLNSRSLIVNSATLKAPEKFSDVFPCYSLSSCRQCWCFHLLNRDTRNLETRFAVVAQPICRTSISVARSLEFSAGACFYLSPCSWRHQGVVLDHNCSKSLKKNCFSAQASGSGCTLHSCVFLWRKAGQLISVSIRLRYRHLTTEVLCCKVLIFITAGCVCYLSLLSLCR